MSAALEIFQDRDFRSSGRESQRQRLTDFDPQGFGTMNAVDQDAIIEQGISSSLPDSDYGAALERGFIGSLAQMAHLGANLADFIPGMDGVEDTLRGVADDAYDASQAPEDQTTGEMYASILGSLPVGLGTAMGVTALAGSGLGAAGASAAVARALAPVVGFAALGGVGAADQGPEAAAKAAMMEGAFGALFPTTQHMRRYARSAILGGAAYGMSPEEMEFQERLGHGLTMALMAGIPRARDPISVLKKLGAKNPYRELDIDQKMLEEQGFHDELETLAFAKDQARQRSQQVEVPEPSPRGEAEGKGDPSVESARGRFPDREKGTNKLVIEERDLELDTKTGLPKFPNHPVEDHPGKNHQSIKEIDYATNLPIKVVKHNDIFNQIAKLFKFPVRRGRLYQDEKPGVAGVEYPIQGQGGPREREWHDFSGYSKIKHLKDVGAGVHEFGHNLSSMFRIQEKIWNNPEVQALYAKNPKISDLPPELQELHHLSYAVGDVEEGLAELIRHWLSNKQYAQNHAPNATKAFEKAAQEVLTKKQWKGLLKLRDQAHRWYDQGSFATAISSIGESGRSEDAMHGRLARRREMGFDDFQGGLELVRTLGIEMPDSFYETMRRLRGTGAIAEGMRNFGVIKEVPDPKNPGKFKMEFEGPGWGEIMKQIAPKDFQDFWYFVTGKAARELIGQTEMPGGGIRKSTPLERLRKDTREKLFEENEIRSMEAKGAGKPEFERTYQQLKDFRVRTADFMQQMGLINSKQRAGWMRKEFVMSLWRDLQTGRQGKGRTTDQLAADAGIYRQHGSTQNLRDPFFSFVEGIQKQITAGLRNRAMLELVDIGQARHRVRGRFHGPKPEGVEGAGVFMTKVDASANIITVGEKSVRQAFEREFKKLFGLSGPEAEQAALWLEAQPGGIDQLALFLGQNKPFGSNILTVMRHGRPEYYEIHDPMLQRTIEAMSRPAQSQLVQQWGKLKTLKQQFIVIEPSFMAANFVRDVAMATIMTRTGNQHLTAALWGLKHIYKQDKMYQDFIANGGAGSTMRDNLHITKARLMRHKGGPMNPSNMVVTFSDVVRGMEIVGRSLENASRVGEYARGRRKGMTASHAAYLAREVSTDFSMRGGNRGILGFANTTIPFFSAMLAGADRGYRAMFRDPTGKAKTAAKIGLVSTASAVLYGMNKQLGATFGHLKDEDGRQMVDFNNLPQWAKTAYWHWYIPTEFSPKTGLPTKFSHLHMPKLWEVGAVATWAELAVESMQQGTDDDRSLAKDFLQVAAGNFNINLIEEGFMLPLPVGVDLAVEQQSNKILFTGSPIETAGMENLQPWQRARSGQTQAVKKWGEMFKGDLGDFTPEFIQSPARAEALLRGFTGNWGNIALQVIDSAVFPGGPALGLDDYPVFRRVYSQAGKYDKNVQNFYENLRSFNQAYGSLREMAKKGDIEGIAEMTLDPDQVEQIGLSPGFDKMNRSIQLMNREIALIRDGAVMTFSTGREKSSAINRIMAQRNEMMKQMNKLASYYRNN